MFELSDRSPEMRPIGTTLIATHDGQPTVLVEVLGEPSYPTALRELAQWLFAHRFDVELYVAFGSDSLLAASTLRDLRSDGVGILVVESNHDIRTEVKPRNPALVVSPDPHLRYGPMANRVYAAVDKFNEVNRQDGLRDMVEIVEGETSELAILACRRGWLRKNESIVSKLDWAGKMNHLASANTYTAGHAPLVDENLKQDLHSFRGSRNLVDHNARGLREIARRERQFHERMVQGPRLLHELVALYRKVRSRPVRPTVVRAPAAVEEPTRVLDT